MLTARPIRYTPRLDEYRSLLTDLGCVVSRDEGDWVELQAGDGRVALHRADQARTDLGFETDDLEAQARDAVGAGLDAELVDAAHGRAIRVRMSDGMEFFIDEGSQHSASTGADARLAVLPLHMTPTVAALRTAYVALGLRPRIASDSGGWADFSVPGGGLLAVHGDETPEAVLSFEYAADVRALRERLDRAGRDAAVVDESYGYSLRLADPDGGADIWVNQAQDDLHGYHRAAS